MIGGCGYVKACPARAGPSSSGMARDNKRARESRDIIEGVV